MLRLQHLPIGPEENAGSLHDRLASLAAELVVPVVDALAAGQVAADPQPEAGATYAHKIDKAEARIDWREPAAAVGRRVRAFSPVPGAFTELEGGRLRILAGEVTAGAGPPGTVLDDRLTVACGADAFRPSQVQLAGARPLATEAFLRGHPVPVGTRVGVPCPATS
jgi:methionyl-tRNA formyltransferase